MLFRSGCVSRIRPTWIHDESLVTLEDAQRLIEFGVADAFNIRVSKCGGLIPSLRLAALARRHNVCIQLGCMVGETSILSAAGLRFLEVCPGVTWAEGCFGSFLLSADVAAKALRFGYAGRPPKLKEPGLGVTVDPIRLKRLCADDAIAAVETGDQPVPLLQPQHLDRLDERVDQPRMPDSVARIDGQFALSIVSDGRRGKNFTDPIGHDVQRSPVWERAQALRSPTGEVRYQGLVSKTNLGFVQDHPTAGAADAESKRADD